MLTINLKSNPTENTGSDNNQPILDQSIGEIVARDYRTAEVFKKHHLDFCCGGKKSVRQACADKKIDEQVIENELNRVDLMGVSHTHQFNHWNIDFLADYILNTHHNYVKSAIPILLEFTRKVSKVHGESHPEVVMIAENFYAAAEELINHMHKEENILFPYIKQLAALSSDASAMPENLFGTIQHPISMMEHEHETVGEIFKNIRQLSDNYTPPAEACMTYKVSFLKLKEFEEDLHQHIHLENNILFPKSIELEERFF